MTEILQYILYIVQTLVALGVVIFVHELGHFLLAKKCGVRVEAFALGFGPALWKHRRGDTEYRIGAIPLGGYVKMSGEVPGEDRTGEPWELTSKSAWNRFQIFVAGALSNLAFAFPLCIAAFMVGKYVHPNVVGVPSVPEFRAGIATGDEIFSVDGESIETLEQYRMAMAGKKRGSTVQGKTRRGDHTFVRKVLQADGRISAPGAIGTGLLQVLTQQLTATLRTAFRAITSRPIKFTATTVARMNDRNRFVPVHILKIAIKYGRKSPDPQRVKGAFLYKIPMTKNGRSFTLEVVLRERDNTVLHFLYK